MSDTNGESLRLIDGYLAKKKDYVCLQSVLDRAKKKLSVLLKRLDDPMSIDPRDNQIKERGQIIFKEDEVHTQKDFEDMVATIGDIQTVTGELTDYERKLKASGYGDIVDDELLRS